MYDPNAYVSTTDSASTDSTSTTGADLEEINKMPAKQKALLRREADLGES